MKKKKIAVIGAGLQGKRRVPPILNHSECELAWVIDLNIQKAIQLVGNSGAQTGTDWKKAIEDPTVDAVLVLTFPDSHAEISIAAMEAGKDVLCEKPLTRTNKEAEKLLEIAKKTKRIVKTGFNHRHHPAVAEAYRLFHEGAIGKAVFGRGKYGIAGRTGIEKEWRSDPSIVSGGQLVDQGIHLIDLFRWFMGDVAQVAGMISTQHWPIQVEENGFAMMKMKKGQIVSIHASVTQWINLFEFEIYGEKGSITVQNLGGSYGVEKLMVNISDPNGPFSYNTTEYRGGDISWDKEWQEFMKAIKTRKQPIGNGEDGYKALKVAHAAYESAKKGIFIDIT